MAKNTSFVLGDHFDSFVAAQIEGGRRPPRPRAHSPKPPQPKPPQPVYFRLSPNFSSSASYGDTLPFTSDRYCAASNAMSSSIVAR